MQVGGYDDDCAFVSERAKILHIRNCPGYGDPVPATTFTQPDTMEGLRKLVPASTQCIDNTGSHQDTGYNQGYADGQRDFRQQLGFDNSLHKQHTDEFKIGYKDGYQAGFDDAQLNVNKNPC